MSKENGELLVLVPGLRKVFCPVHMEVGTLVGTVPGDRRKFGSSGTGRCRQSLNPGRLCALLVKLQSIENLDSKNYND